VAHPEHAHRCLAHRGEGFGEDVVELGAAIDEAAQLVRLALKLFIGERLDLRLEPIDLVDDLARSLDVTLVGRAEDGFDDG